MRQLSAYDARKNGAFWPLTFVLLVAMALLLDREAHSLQRQTDTPAAARDSAIHGVVTQALASIAADPSASFAVWFDGQPAYEKVFADGGPSQANLGAATQSIASMAIAIALERQWIMSLDTPINQQWPQLLAQQHNELSLRHVMNMTAGMTEPGLATQPAATEPVDCAQWAQGVARYAVPGSRWSYDSRASCLLASIVHQATNAPLDQFLARHLFAPMGIRTWSWAIDSTGVPTVSTGLHMSASDLAKIGTLVAQRGHWQGQQLIDSAYFDEIGRHKEELPGGGGYSLLWRIGLPRLSTEEFTFREHILWAQAGAHQFLFVDPHTQTVIATLHRSPLDDDARGEGRDAHEWFRAAANILAARRAYRLGQ